MDDIFLNLVILFLVVAVAILLFKGISPIFLRIKFGKYSKGRLIIISILFLLSVGGFFLTNLFTIDPDVVSGNGNPALLIIIPLVPVFIIFNLLLGAYVYSLIPKKFTSYIILAFSIGSFIFFTWREAELVKDLYPQIDVSYQSFLLNQYTNPFFFNLFTFAIAIILSVAVSSLCSLKNSS